MIVWPADAVAIASDHCLAGRRRSREIIESGSGAPDKDTVKARERRNSRESRRNSKELAEDVAEQLAAAPASGGMGS